MEGQLQKDFTKRQHNGKIVAERRYKKKTQWKDNCRKTLNNHCTQEE
jgi:hypothetical protein